MPITTKKHPRLKTGTRVFSAVFGHGTVLKRNKWQADDITLVQYDEQSRHTYSFTDQLKVSKDPK